MLLEEEVEVVGVTSATNDGDMPFPLLLLLLLMRIVLVDSVLLGRRWSRCGRDASFISFFSGVTLISQCTTEIRLPP